MLLISRLKLGWTSSLLKKSQASVEQGENGRKSAVTTVVPDTPVHEHFEAVFNAVTRRLRIFQHTARTSWRSHVLALITIDWLLVSGTAAAGSISHHTFVSETLGREYAYNVYLPNDYADSGLSYPVLYLLHGSNGDEHDWPAYGGVQQIANGLISDGLMPPAVIVMPGAKSWWVDGYNEKAETAFFDDLIPHVESTWSVIPARDGRVLAGLSAGGYGTVNFVFKYPELFAAGAALSPASYVPYPPPNSSAREHAAYLNTDGTFDRAVWDRLNYTQYIVSYKQQDIVVPLYISSGDHDRFDIAYHAAVLYQALREHQPERVEFRVVDGDHEWDVWSESLPEAIIYVFRYTSGPIGAARSKRAVTVTPAFESP